jgi:uncharacterized protein YqjF (DUF2071 family)
MLPELGRDGGVSPTAPPLTGPALFDQSWLDLFFLHWAVDPAVVAPFMPRGVRPDVFDGATYVGLVPFRMVGAGLGHRHPTPYLGTFLECNVRLYSVDDEGRHGVVFRSLEATRSLTSMAARWGYRLPYTWANMHVRRRGDRWWWRSDRRYPLGGGSMRLEAQTGEEIEPTDLEVFVTARWGLHHEAFGATWWTPNEHDPWVLHAAKVVELRQDLVAQAGIVVADQPTLRPLYSPGVYTAFGFPQRIS